jgi:prepilin-type N-terminal cleavage/methylation domain-containing protein
MKTLPEPSVLTGSRHASRSGFTLLELVTVVFLLGLALAEGLPAARNLKDRMAVVGAREAVVGVFHRARMEAVARGGARIVLVVSPPGVELWSAGARRSALDLAEGFDVEMALSTGRERAEIGFDPLGLGRVASQTLVFTRNGAEAGLVVSSFGRVTRR